MFTILVVGIRSKTWSNKNAAISAPTALATCFSIALISPPPLIAATIKSNATPYPVFCSTPHKYFVSSCDTMSSVPSTIGPPGILNSSYIISFEYS